MTVRIRGIEDVNHVLTQIAPREGINLIRNTVFDISQQLAKSAKGYSPDRTGLLDKVTKAKRSRGTKTTAVAEVIVGKRAFYWQFLEYGQGPDNVEHAMFLKALQAMRPDMDRVYLEAFTRKLVARLARQAKAAK